MAKKINVAFLLTRIREKGGISRVTSIISKELAKDERFNIHLVSYQKREESGYDWDQNLFYHELVDARVKMKRGMLKANKRLRKIIAQNGIQIVVSCGQEVGPLGVLCTRFGKTKLVYWSHSSFKGKTHSKFKVANEYFTTSFADVVVSLTKTDKVNYKKGTLAKKVIQIYNPVDGRLLGSQSTYDADSHKIISVGRLVFQKNFLLLVDVAKLVLESNPKASWHIFGSGYLEQEIQEKIVANGLQGRLILEGQSDNLYNQYGEHAMLVMTSRFEGFPMSLLEGMACKLPLVSFDIPTGPNEIIRDGENGYLIPPNDITAMANKIDDLLKNRERRIAFSHASQEQIGMFGLPQIVDEWSTLFKSLAHNEVSSSM